MPDRIDPEQAIAVSVAVLRGSDSYAFFDESCVFMDDGLTNPDWKLEFGKTYLVDIQVKGSNASLWHAK